MVISERLSDWIFDQPFQTGLTTSGHPLACASGVASIESLRDEGLVEQAAALGEVMAQELHGLAERHDRIGDVRGLGLLWGVELVSDRESREPLDARPIAKEALARGLHLFVRGNVVLVAPPLVISRGDLAEGLALLDEVLDRDYLYR